MQAEETEYTSYESICVSDTLDEGSSACVAAGLFFGDDEGKSFMINALAKDLAVERFQRLTVRWSMVKIGDRRGR